MMRAIIVCMACVACGAEAGPAPAGDGGTEAAVADRPQSTPECQARRMLDCNGDGQCDTPTGDANCGACGRACVAPRRCDSAGTLCF